MNIMYLKDGNIYALLTSILIGLLLLTSTPVHGQESAKKDMVTIRIKAIPGYTLVLIKGGCFNMGDIFGDGDPDEVPVHKVCVDDFYMGVHEVTQKEWFEVMGTRPSSLVDCNECPVENVSYMDVQRFIEKLNSMSERIYRLPTEAEWEYGARNGGRKYKWAGTNKESELEDYAWFRDNAGDRPHPVAQKKPNLLGLYDMNGNVQEWVEDLYGVEYYSKSPVNNPDGAWWSQYHSVRGGSFLNSAWGIRNSIRYHFTPDDHGREFGFRLATSGSATR